MEAEKLYFIKQKAKSKVLFFFYIYMNLKFTSEEDIVP